MKLRNKKTGTIVDVLLNPTFTEYNRDGSVKNINTFNSLAELTKEWEDYAEPKEYWYIDDTGVIQIGQVLSSEINMRKAIGNYFSSREEAEKVVSLLKRIAIIKSYGCNVSEYINKTVLSIEDYYERNKDEKRICR